MRTPRNETESEQDYVVDRAPNLREQRITPKRYDAQPQPYPYVFEKIKDDMQDFLSDESPIVPNRNMVELGDLSGMKSILELEHTPVRRYKEKAINPSPGTNLDGRGESHWVYPEEDGKYIIPQPIEVPTAATGESADVNEFESLLNHLENTPKTIKSMFPCRGLGQDDNYKEERVYTSNIASIVNSAFSVYPKKEVVKTVYKTTDKPRNKFPRDVFKANFKSKHMIP